MKKVYIILFSVLFLLVTKNAFAAKGKAAVYKVTMNEDEDSSQETLEEEIAS